MCLLAYISPHVEVEEMDLEIACMNNPDGFGWALRLPEGKLQVGHSMNPNEAISGFMDARRARPDSHGLFHARLATHGTRDLYNVHPFYIGGGTTSVLGHNGVLPLKPSKEDKRSDTRLWAETMMSSKGIRALDRREAVQAMGHRIGGNKFVILTVKPGARSPYYIVNEDLGHWREGIWWSNDSYRSIRERYWLGKSDSVREVGRDRSVPFGFGAGTVMGPRTGSVPTPSTPLGAWRNQKDDEAVVDADVAWDVKEIIEAGHDELLALVADREKREEKDKSVKDRKCPECRAGLDPTDIHVYGCCPVCGLCLDCYEPLASCLCYSPSPSGVWTPQNAEHQPALVEWPD